MVKIEKAKDAYLNVMKTIVEGPSLLRKQLDSLGHSFALGRSMISQSVKLTIGLFGSEVADYSKRLSDVQKEFKNALNVQVAVQVNNLGMSAELDSLRC